MNEESLREFSHISRKTRKLINQAHDIKTDRRPSHPSNLGRHRAVVILAWAVLDTYALKSVKFCPARVLLKMATCSFGKIPFLDLCEHRVGAPPFGHQRSPQRRLTAGGYVCSQMKNSLSNGVRGASRVIGKACTGYRPVAKRTHDTISTRRWPRGPGGSVTLPSAAPMGHHCCQEGHWFVIV